VSLAWRKYINFLLSGLVVFGAVLIFVVFSLAPDKGYLGFGSFFISLFLFLLCLFTILGFYARRRISNNEVLYYNLRTAFRQGTIAALYATLIMVMQAARLLTWWDAILLGLALIFFDVFFREKK